MAAPFWRLYTVDTEGVSIQWENTTYPLVPGRWLLIAPETPFSGVQTKPAQQYYLHFCLGIPMDTGTPMICEWPMKNDEAEMVADIFSGKNAKGQEGMGVTVLEHIIGAIRHIPKERWTESQYDPIMIEALRMMENAMNAPLSNDQMAARLHMSLRSFQRYFQNHMGVPPQQYYLTMRLNHAARLLHETSWSMERIAAECGFCDRYTLTKHFTRQRHISPAAYRKYHASHHPV